MRPFEVVSPFSPAGDQGQAIRAFFSRKAAGYDTGTPAPLQGRKNGEAPDTLTGCLPN
jgi:hypothetical protein